MELKNEFEAIRNWAETKGIYSSGDVKTQTLKLYEEAGELAKAILKKDKEEFIDAIGDCMVVLVSIAELGNQFFEDEDRITIEGCINSAYSVISKRKGKMSNGTFVKDGL
jgi:NTP pyrophosphatase (non-canonical NTP hydrolase)